MELRINKVISDYGICSRREADTLIAEGRVTINGEIAEMGSKVTEDDDLEVDGDAIPLHGIFRAEKIRREAEEAEELESPDGLGRRKGSKGFIPKGKRSPSEPFSSGIGSKSTKMPRKFKDRDDTDYFSRNERKKTPRDKSRSSGFEIRKKR